MSELEIKPETDHETGLQSATETEARQSSSDASYDSKGPEFFPVSEGKLMTLYILSFGLYGIYWFYKNWKLQQPRMEKNILPMVRAIFSIFFTHSLFKIINQRAEQLETKHSFNANVLATFFVATIVVSNVIDNFSFSSAAMMDLSNNSIIITSIGLFMLSAYPLVKVQATVNRINNDMLGYLNHKYSLWNYVMMALCVILWILLAMGLLAESMGLAV